MTRRRRNKKAPTRCTAIGANIRETLSSYSNGDSTPIPEKTSISQSGIETMQPDGEYCGRPGKIKRTGTIHDTITGYDFRVDKPLTPVKAARAKCLECVGNQYGAVRDCAIFDCPLWPYRMGRSPNRNN